MIIKRVSGGLLFLVCVLLIDTVDLFADGDTRKSWQVDQEKVVQDEAGMENQGGEGVMDPRLPPVIPGEEVIRQGKRIRVISTSGPVPLRERRLKREDSAHRYEPEVIIDMRDRFKDRGSKRYRRDSEKNKSEYRNKDRNHYLDRRRRH